MKRMLTGVAGLLLVAFAVAFVASAAQADTVTQPVGEAGTVTYAFDGDSVSFVAAAPADGWTFSVDRADGDHLKVTFRNASGAEIEFEVEAGDTGTSVPNDTTGSTLDDDDDDSTSTTVDDGEGDEDSDDNSDPGSGDDDDDDNSGPGSGDDDDDDNSGPGSGDDDDDDNSGPGSGDDDDDDDEEDADDSDVTTTTVAG